MNIKMSRRLAAPVTLVAVSLTMVGCSGSASPESSASSQAILNQVAACQQLETIIGPLLGATMGSMTPAQQQEAIRKAGAALQAAVIAYEPQLQEMVKNLETQLASIAPSATASASASGSGTNKIASDFVKAAAQITAACQAVGVTLV